MNVTAGIDNERERVYQKAEQIDAQLQRMSEDLKVTTMKIIHKTVIVRVFLNTGYTKD